MLGHERKKLYKRDVPVKTIRCVQRLKGFLGLEVLRDIFSVL